MSLRDADEMWPWELPTEEYGLSYDALSALVAVCITVVAMAALAGLREVLRR